MNDISENISEIIKTAAPTFKFLREDYCQGCQRPLLIYETEIVGGERKGEKTEVNLRKRVEGVDYGCVCENIKLANMAIEAERELESRKAKERFDYYSLINESLKDATLDNYIPTNEGLAKAKHQVSEFINNFDGKRNLLLHGSYGTGKSHLSISATKELMKQKYNCLFLSLPKLLTKIKDTYNNNGFTEDELLRAIQGVDLLVLDDIGAEHHTEWVNSKLFEVMDDRAGKSTIYTTNLNSKELREKINERNFSRMMENTSIVTMNGPDYRRKEF